MPKLIIEREILNAGNLTRQELQATSQKSCSILEKLGPRIQWVESFVTDDKIYCVYLAPDQEMIREHARQAGLPANRVSRVSSIIDPTTAEGWDTALVAHALVRAASTIVSTHGGPGRRGVECSRVLARRDAARTSACATVRPSSQPHSPASDRAAVSCRAT